MFTRNIYCNILGLWDVKLVKKKVNLNLIGWLYLPLRY